MSFHDIFLSTSITNNLMRSKDTIQYLDKIQRRLATGNSINDPLDNPGNYYASQVHRNRATDLSARKDEISESIQLTKAADNGITSIISLINNAKGIVQTARDVTAAERSELASQYNHLLEQVDYLAADANYKGKNLLANGVKTVLFNEDGSNSLTLIGFSASRAGLGIEPASDDWADVNALDDAENNLESAINTLERQLTKFVTNLNVITIRQNFIGDTINTLIEGADNLTLSNMSEESANMAMMDMRYKLTVISLGLATQSTRSVLRIF